MADVTPCQVFVVILLAAARLLYDVHSATRCCLRPNPPRNGTWHAIASAVLPPVILQLLMDRWQSRYNCRGKYSRIRRWDRLCELIKNGPLRPVNPDNHHPLGGDEPSTNLRSCLLTISAEFWCYFEDSEFSINRTCCDCVIGSFQCPTHDKPGSFVQHYRARTEAELLDVAEGIFGPDPQAGIDMAQKLPAILPSRKVQMACLEYLLKSCGQNDMVPGSMQIDLHDNPARTPFCGGFADVFKCTVGSRVRPVEVAVKVLRTCTNVDMPKMTRNFHKEVITWNFLRHPNVLPLLGVLRDRSRYRFAMVSEWMEHGNINHFVRTHWDVNRFQLLADVARGLRYMHYCGMVHGDLKGSNILIDLNGHARLADFGLVTLRNDPTASGHEGTCQWMSPELFYPERFGFEHSRRTTASDCYALGMVIYEVLSGRLPFSGQGYWAVVLKVLGGERPERPQGVEGNLFPDSVWRIAEECWHHRPDFRRTAWGVLTFFERESGSWTPPPPPQVAEDSQPENLSTWSASDRSTRQSVGGGVFTIPS